MTAPPESMLAGLTEDERTFLALNVSFDCPTCGHGYRCHYQQHGGCRECRFPVEGTGTDCIQTMTSALGWGLTPGVEGILTARTARIAELEAALAAAEARLRAVEALAARWETVPRPVVGWGSGLSATESGNRLGAWNVLQTRAAALRAALTPPQPAP